MVRSLIYVLVLVSSDVLNKSALTHFSVLWIGMAFVPVLTWCKVQTYYVSKIFALYRKKNKNWCTTVRVITNIEGAVVF